MKVYVRPPNSVSVAMSRVSRALEIYSPKEITIVEDRRDADMEVLHIIDYKGVTPIISGLISSGKSYAIIQYCAGSPGFPGVKFWESIWDYACVVWSYLDLRILFSKEFSNFYFAPLGVDGTFVDQNLERIYTILTSGYVAESESINEVAEAVFNFGGLQYHLGPRIVNYGTVLCRNKIPDRELINAYSSSQFVSGLRKYEGFELPAAEGILCGARPILYDRRHYREWYDGLGEFIPEDENVVLNLEALFKEGAKPVTEKEKIEARKRFNWKTIIKGFWNFVIS